MLEVGTTAHSSRDEVDKAQNVQGEQGSKVDSEKRSDSLNVSPPTDDVCQEEVQIDGVAEGS